MTTFQSLEESEAWQKARQLTMEIYTISGQGSFFKDAGARDQIRGAAVLALSSIAQGFEQVGSDEAVRFLSQATKAVGEIRTQLYAAVDRGHLSKVSLDRLFALATEAGHTIDEFLKYLQKSSQKGAPPK